MSEEFLKSCLPTLEYLKFGNIFSASIKNFNFKMFPNLRSNEVRVVVFEGIFCFEKSEMLFEERFKLKEGVLEEIFCWLKEKKERLKNK